MSSSHPAASSSSRSTSSGSRLSAVPEVPRLQLSVLGPMEARTGGSEVALGSPQQQAVLAALVMHEVAHVELPALVAGLWGEDAPVSAAGTVRTYLSRLRRALGPASELLRATGGGYRLDRAGYDLDLTAFTVRRERAAEATRRGDTAAAAEQLRAALSLWRGTPLSGLPGPYAESQRERLTQLHDTVVEELLAAEVELGHLTEALGELTVLIAQQPLRERLRELQVLALWRLGRQAEALSAYAQARTVLAEELGVDPGPALQALQELVLTGTPPVPAGPVAPAVRATPAPAQLPGEVARITGREQDLARLAEAAADTGAAARVVAVSGMGGVGKTTLAVHFARSRAADHPDGQLHADLRGFDPVHRPVDPAEALRGFLEALGVPPQGVPTDLEGRAALYRTLLHGRRMLVLLDNARDAEQVRPLLPGDPGTLVVVTSRDPLAGLVVTAGARPVALDVLDPGAAGEFLRRRLGDRRVDAEPAAVDRLAERTGGLPLALAVVAARAAISPAMSLAALAEELGAGPLDAMATSDPVSDLRAVLAPSYRALAPDAARVFRALAAQPGADTGTAAVASASGLDRSPVGRLLRQLADSALVTQPRPDRWRMHDLLLAYAGEVTGGPERAEFVVRTTAHHLHTTAAARRVHFPQRVPLDLPPLPTGVSPEVLGDAAAVVGWFATEAASLVSVVQQAAAAGLDQDVLQLTALLLPLQDRLGRPADAVVCQHLALAAAERADDRSWLGRVHHGLASAYDSLGDAALSIDHLRSAITAYRMAGVRRGEAEAHAQLAETLSEVAGPPDPHRDAEVREHLEAALALIQELGDRQLEAMFRVDAGSRLLSAGDAAGAEQEWSRSRDLFRAVGDDRWMLEVEVKLAHAALAQGRVTEALARYREVARSAPDQDARVLVEATAGVGHALVASGDVPGARSAWAEAVRAIDRLDPAGELGWARAVRAELADLLAGAPTPPGS
ncbi:winged helix-turn-helix domain-containing protein [Modestobacter sp. L9-4]|uniref:AfsR/SARP family transcriptional regulator n=1 Tax=Modestobacter sp. L9-4 TaxID=2851567 RepID=UPI001C760E12|nr:BTAD domain-containing putative transcriptional regulator [Modestobacter sp. L9-4]QXG76069.1 winged helix-turn-helix domain-containing protein [Modestobacter sp. L9-4]